ncbi:hypothetical protein U729_3270 (plasmid) [Clostridium baratii str. Sullivan]|uniref:Insertion element IS150 protein InsJ-like helix-turn-helix domain-containing protein n=1 Tax=Clostridium baratii str. Sullivan TaxID=1415775 RepID=A0A0A7G2F7_9CLOT|nr:helix-turn-helix domain-containing protein [Clostridium baratii]AIY85225.1 hypothetical protein U729_3270 [Clostridium baratii str. Sullivan]
MKSNRKITEDDAINIVNLYKEGLSASEIGKMYEVDRRTIMYWIGKYDKDIIRNQRKIEKEKYELIYKEFLKGIPFERLSKKYNVPISSIYRYARKNKGFLREKTLTKYNDVLDDIIKDYENNATIKDISKKFNICEETLNIILVQVGSKDFTGVREAKNRLVKNYFDNLDEHKAYILGIIYSTFKFQNDYGKEESMLVLTVSNKYRYLLDEIGKSIYLTTYPKPIANKRSCYLRVRSPKFIDDLINKFDILGTPKIPNNLIKQFVKGYLEYSCEIKEDVVNIKYKNTGTKDFILEYLAENGIVATKVKSKCAKIEGEENIKSFIKLYN